MAALLACLALPAGAGAQERQLEPTIIVDAATASTTAPVASTTTLQAGQSYLLVVNGQDTVTFPTTGGGTFRYFMDGVYCFDENPARPEFGCRTRPQVFERSGLTVRLGSPGDGSAENFRPFYAKLGNTSAPPFVAGHRYELRFTPPFGGRLLMAVTPPPTLRVTCRVTPAGLQVRVTPRRSGVSLRRLVGARLKVGLARVPESKRTAGPTISFRR